MPIDNHRINVTFEPATASILADLARLEHKSLSSLAKELILEALDRLEDKILSAITEQRDTLKAKRVKHDDLWN
jgi:hypothetical protein